MEDGNVFKMQLLAEAGNCISIPEILRAVGVYEDEAGSSFVPVH